MESEPESLAFWKTYMDSILSPLHALLPTQSGVSREGLTIVSLIFPESSDLSPRGF